MAIVEGPVGDVEVRANTTTDGHQQSGTVAFEPDGDYVVVWHHVSGFGGTRVEGIRMQRYNAAGVAQGGETTLVTDARLPNIVTDGAGNFLVTYTKNSGSRWAQWYHNNGSLRGGEFAVEGNSLFRDEIAVDADGDLSVAWMASGLDFPGFEARVSLYDAAGVKKGDFAISPIPDSRLFAPRVAMDDSGNLVVGYLSSPFGGGGLMGDLYVQRFSAAGVRQGGPVLVFPGQTPSFSIDAAAGGDFVVAYLGEPERTWTTKLSIARFNAAGVLQGSRALVAEDVSTSFGPRVAVDADGDFVVSWTRHHNGPSNTADVHARRYLASGTSQTEEFRVNSTIPSGQHFESLATSPGGDFTILYTSPDGNSVGIFVRHYTLGNNDAATANNDTYTVNQDGMLVVTASEGVLENDREFDGDGAKSDFDGDGTPDVADADDDNDGIADTLDGLAGRVELKLLGIPSHGVVYLNEDGSLQYTPYAGYAGADSFTYYVVEPSNGMRSNVATVSVNVVPLAGRSSFAGQNLVIPAAAANYTLANWGVFTPGPAGPYSPSYAVSGVSNPALFSVQPTVDASGALSFSAAGPAGTTTFDVTLNDGAGGGETHTFVLHVGHTETTLRPVVFTDGVLQVYGSPTSYDVIEVVGLSPNGDLAIDGTAGQWRVLGLPGGLSILALDGGSIVEVNNLYLGGHFSFIGGEGTDHLLCGLKGIVSPERFLVSTGGGADIVDCLNTYVEFDGRIETGDGDDVVRLYDQVAIPWQFVLSYSSGHGSGIVTGEGNDSVLVRYEFVVGNFGIVGEGGNDYMQVYGSAFTGQLSLFGSAGHDACVADTNYAPAGLNIYGDEGADSLLAANNIHGQGDVFIDGDVGGDLIEVRNIAADQLSIAGDAGNDAVEVKYSLLQLLYGDLGDGDDVLTLTSNTITGSLFLDGGNGADRLRDLGGTYPGTSSRVRWEFS